MLVFKLRPPLPWSSLHSGSWSGQMERCIIWSSHMVLESYFKTKPINQFPSKLHVDTCLQASTVLSPKYAFSQQFFMLFQWYLHILSKQEAGRMLNVESEHLSSVRCSGDTVVLNITLLLVETDKELNCVFLGQRLSCLPVLHDLLSSLNIFCWKIFILLCLLWQKETAIHLIFESRDSPMWGQLERAVLFCLFSKKVLSYFKFASKEAEALVSTKEHSFSNDSC